MNFTFYIIKCLFIFIYLTSIINTIDLLNSKFVLNINGNSHYLNYYYITLFFGNKKENQTFLLDTTASVTSSPCNLCPSCGDHANDYFNIKSNLSIIKYDSYECIELPNVLYNSPKNDILNNEDNCNFLYNFNNKTKISGFYLNNLISFEPITKKIDNEEDEEDYIHEKNEFELPIGCTMNETEEFQSRIADGVIGLNRHNKSFISIMYDMNIIKKNLFSICLDEYGGYFSLGDVDTKYHIDSNISYVNLYSYSDLYQLVINNIVIGSTEINNKYISIIDSSSTISYFPKDIFNMMMIGIFSECADKNGECGTIKRTEGYGICAEFKDLNDMNNAIYYIWPTIIIKFNGYDFYWEPKNYYINHSSSTIYRACFGFDTEENITTIILGTNFMHGHDIIFDREENRIGFAEAECGRKMHKKVNIITYKKRINEAKINKDINKNKEVLKNDEETKKYIKKDEDNDELKESEEKKETIIINDTNNTIDGLYLNFFAIFIIFIILIIFNYVNCNNSNNNNYQERYKNEPNLIQKENEKKDINQIKPIGQIIEMI